MHQKWLSKQKYLFKESGKIPLPKLNFRATHCSSTYQDTKITRTTVQPYSITRHQELLLKDCRSLALRSCTKRYSRSTFQQKIIMYLHLTKPGDHVLSVTAVDRLRAIIYPISLFRTLQLIILACDCRVSIHFTIETKNFAQSEVLQIPDKI